MSSLMARCRWFCLAFGLIVAASGAGAQDVQLPAVNDNPSNDQNFAGVYVRDSAIAVERLTLAQRMERMKEWGKSADLYQEILTKYPDRVVPAPLDGDNRESRYTSVTETVLQALCKWPQEGLDVYRSRYETTALSLIATATASAQSVDLATLHRVFSLYFPTDAAKSAGIHLMDGYFEQGDYAAVAQIGQRLLDWHPNLRAERPLVIYRTALAQMLVGDKDAAKHLADELRRLYPAATGAIRGQDVVLADSLEKDLADGGSLVRGEGGDSWTTVGGDETRGKVSSSLIKPGARVYSIPLTRVTWQQVPDANTRNTIQQFDTAQRQMGAGLGIFPAVDHGELFFQDNVCIYGINLDSGLPLSGWADTYPSRNGVYRIPGNASPVPGGQQFCVSINDKYVTAVMRERDELAEVNGISSPQETTLVCLDRQSGKQLWIKSASQLPEAQSSLRNLEFGGAPLIVGDNLYIVGRENKGQQFQDCYILCFNIANGEFRWASYIAGAISEQAVGQNQLFFSDDPVSHIAYAGGRLFVTTNLGAIASLDAYSGIVAWLDIYREESVFSTITPFMPGGGMAPNVGSGQALAAPPWFYNPPIVQDGRVFVLPSDSSYLLVYDAATGREIKRIWLADLPPGTDGDPAQPNTLLGVNGEMIYLASPTRVWQLPWRAYDHNSDNHQPTAQGYWASVSWMQLSGGSPTPLIRGRAFVTGDAIYVPTTTALLRVRLRTGGLDAKDSSFPRNGWEEGQEGPGNVIVSEDHVIIAGDQRVSVYADLEVARARLEREVAASPTDPQPRLHYAEVMFAAGQVALAQDKLEEAFRLLGGDQLQAGALRDRAFNDSMNFAQRLAAKPDHAQETNHLFDLAKQAAQTTIQQVTYRMGRGEFDVASNNLAAALGLYQEVLADPAMRLAPLPDPDTAATSTAAQEAQKGIDQVLTLPGGRDAYAALERAAAAEMQAADAAHDPAKLLNVALLYPNSHVAHQAMMRAADVFETSGNPRESTLVLRQLLNESHDADRAGVLEAMSRNYLKMPGRLEAAVSRLTQAASIEPETKLHKPLLLPDGTVLQDMTLRDARLRLSRLLAAANTGALPDLHFPTHAEQLAHKQRTNQFPQDPFLLPSPRSVIQGVNAMVVPLQGFARNDRIFAWSANGGLSVYPAGNNTPISTCPAVRTLPRGIAWVDDLVLAWTDDSAILIEPDSGRVRWEVDVASLPGIEVASNLADAPEPGPEQALQMRRNMLQIQVQIQLQGRLAGRRAAVIPPMPVDNPAPRAEQIVQVIPIRDRIIVSTSIGRIMGVDTADGRVTWQTRVGSQAADALVANDDFTVARVPHDQQVQLVVLNSFSGELTGRKTFRIQQNFYPINLALSEDGTLVYTTPNQLCIQDLQETSLAEDGMEPRITTDPANDRSLFVSPTGANRLLVHDGRAFVLSDQGKLIRIYSLDTGKPWAFHVSDDEPAPAESGTLSTQSPGGANMELQLSGNYVYAMSGASLSGFNIDHPDYNWEAPTTLTSPDNYEQFLLGRDFLVAADRMVPLTPGSHAGGIRLRAFSRAHVPADTDKESGWPCSYPIAHTENVSAWQVFEGGIAYFDGGAIHMMMGAREAMENAEVRH